jgi:hypothetical protein
MASDSDEVLHIKVFDTGTYEGRVTPEVIPFASNTVFNLLRDVAYLCPDGPRKEAWGRMRDEAERLLREDRPNAFAAYDTARVEAP